MKPKNQLIDLKKLNQIYAERIKELRFKLFKITFYLGLYEIFHINYIYLYTAIVHFILKIF